MTPTQAARLAGFNSQLNASGESVALPSGQVVTALIDRGIVQQVRRSGIPDFKTKSSASIEFLSVQQKPIVGQSIMLVSDPVKRFRVQECFDETGYSIRCTCEPYEATA